MDEKQFKKHLADLAHGHHHPEEHDWDAGAVEKTDQPTHIAPDEPGSVVTRAKTRPLKRQLADAGVDLIFDDCGELSETMVRQFASMLDPAILSLGSSRRLWEDAALVPPNVVLFGNLPTKSFYSDSVMPAAKVEGLTSDLVARMKQAGHPHILGSECDVLHVAEAAE